jgi:hypothetical protein
MAATHTLTYKGPGVARVRISDAKAITFVGSGNRDLTLSSGKHLVTFGVSGQAGTSWSFSLDEEADAGDNIWKRAGKVPASGLEVRTDEFGV